MSYTIQSAKYANADNTAVILQTAEAGAVAVSAERPALWAQFQAWLPGNSCAAFVPTTPIDLADLDNLDKTLKAIGLILRDYTNALQAGTHTQKSVAQLKADFAAKFNSLP